MRSHYSYRYFILSGIILCLFFFTVQETKGTSLELLSPKYEESWIKLKRSLITGRGSAVILTSATEKNNHTIKMDLRIKVNCKSGEKLSDMHFRDFQNNYHAWLDSDATDVIALKNVAVTTVETLRVMCGRVNKTYSFDFKIPVSYSCTDKHSDVDEEIQNINDTLRIPLKTICEDVRATN